MLKTKKAQGIPMETVIIAIIVLVVLVVIIAFFVGGTSTVIQKVKQLFGGATTGTDMQTATQFCQQYCDQLVQSGKDQGDKNDAYCYKWFNIDTTGSGNADRGLRGKSDPKAGYVKYYCGSTYPSSAPPENPTDTIGVTCAKPCSQI